MYLADEIKGGNRMRIWQLFYLIGLLLLTAIDTGCLKKTPDAPPDTSGQNPDLTANTSIGELKLKTSGSVLTGHLVIGGIVVMSDRSGNLYKKIIVQDNTGGIEISIDQQDIYAELPAGRSVFIKCDGLFLGEKDGIMQLGSQPDANGYVSPIPSEKINDLIFPGQFPVALQPDTFSLAQLATSIGNDKHLNTLVVIRNIEFVDSNSNVPYAVPPDQSAATERVLQNCSGASISLQTSAYAKFQPFLPPYGNGCITVIYTAFRGTPYLLIRDTTDIQFHQARCHSLPGSGQTISILQLKQLYPGHEFELPDYHISGVLISDKAYKNTPANQMVLQGGTNDAGIMIQFNQPVSYHLGDSLVINTQGAVIYNHYGTIALKNVAPNRIQIAGQDKTIRPTTATVAQVMTSPKSYVSRLIRIANIYWTRTAGTLSGQSGNLYFSDGTDTMAHFCEQAASFGSDPIRDSTAAFITGYIFIRNQQPYLKMRNPEMPEKDLQY